MERILLVDDEPNVLTAFKRRLSSQFEFYTASSAKEGIEILQRIGGVSVIISDMNMPDVNGVDFLKECARRSPDAVRVMLTGLIDQKTAAKAINEGGVFRFINKPISLDELEKTIQDCLVQRKLIKQEKDLLQNTLGGVIKLITDPLSFVDPIGVDTSNRLRKVVKELAGVLGASSIELELGAMASGIGRLSLPLELLARLGQGGALEKQEEEVLSRSVGVSARLLKEIPRFEKISLMLEGVARGESRDPLLQQQAKIFQIGSKIVAADKDSLPAAEALTLIQSTLTPEEIQLVKALLGATPKIEAPDKEGFNVTIKDLCPGQRILYDVKDNAGRLLLKKGFLVTPAVIERLRNHQELIGIASPLIVNEMIPAKE